YTEQTDGLSKSWAGERVWCNPPYRPDLLPLWVRKAYEESQRGALVVLLIPVRSDTRWWHAYVTKGEARLLPGRVKFWLPGVRSTSSPWPSAIVVFRPPSFPLADTVEV